MDKPTAICHCNFSKVVEKRLYERWGILTFYSDIYIFIVFLTFYSDVYIFIIFLTFYSDVYIFIIVDCCCHSAKQNRDNIIQKSRKENPQKLTQLSSRSHPRHLVGKRTDKNQIKI